MMKIKEFVNLMTGKFDNKEQFTAMKKAGKIYPYAQHVNTACNDKIRNIPEDFGGIFIVEESYYETCLLYTSDKCESQCKGRIHKIIGWEPESTVQKGNGACNKESVAHYNKKYKQFLLSWCMPYSSVSWDTSAANRKNSGFPSAYWKTTGIRQKTTNIFWKYTMRSGII